MDSQQLTALLGTIGALAVSVLAWLGGRRQGEALAGKTQAEGIVSLGDQMGKWADRYREDMASDRARAERLETALDAEIVARRALSTQVAELEARLAAALRRVAELEARLKTAGLSANGDAA